MNEVDVHRFEGAGYYPVVDFEHWRVAILNSETELLLENLTFAQRHSFTDEVFVLLEGQCILFSFGDDENQLGDCKRIVMEKNIVYNVRKNIWHTHALAPHTKVLVVENKDTTEENSPRLPLKNRLRK